MLSPVNFCLLVCAVHHPREALYLHHANAAGRGLEPDSVQPRRFHAARVRHQLRRNAAHPDSRKLPPAPDILFGQTVRGGGATRGVQAVPASSGRR